MSNIKYIKFTFSSGIWFYYLINGLQYLIIIVNNITKSSIKYFPFISLFLWSFLYTFLYPKHQFLPVLEDVTVSFMHELKPVQPFIDTPQLWQNNDFTSMQLRIIQINSVGLLPNCPTLNFETLKFLQCRHLFINTDITTQVYKYVPSHTLLLCLKQQTMLCRKKLLLFNKIQSVSKLFQQIEFYTTSI